ncbi:glycosyl transferase family 21 domain-containing protein [Hirsutella rhossiliensis]|uniref:Ceramide glucosyltransferase n=1 Tax=Hirsutella rhossiliensis TaxID=111463 RepID=A0A9P8SNL7_9HYPO|nr:glycosyl transferase family 21 domain-containing protein [Hirsutella rhossiliensis]KAH0968015.1 glycosyl transferase family 21 domain-containing protein [Hirsutella rhossiliensis]
MIPLIETAAFICLVWSVVIVCVQLVGISAVFRYFSRRPNPPVSSRLGKDAPAVTIIRPVKGIEPHLYDCIASTLQQDYPVDKVSLRLCIEDENDPAYPILKKLVADFPAFDIQLLLESRDPALHGPNAYLNLGPNPKIRNISRAYREAKGDIIWIIDCNVWASSGVLGRMVDKLAGFADGQRSMTPYKFVHQMPFLATQTTPGAEPSAAAAGGALTRIIRNGGGRLDEMFFGTTHVKFYGAINAVGVAPCIVGKSNMFRKSHLDLATTPSRNPLIEKDDVRPTGVDYFSHNICEDHLIGDLLWRSNIAGHRNHGMVWGDLAVQPMAGMSVSAYAARRIRWLRARKFTVLVATLVEPGVESLVCCAYFSFALTTLPWFRAHLGIPQTWSAAALIWTICVMSWMCVDRIVFGLLHAGTTIEVDENTPRYARGTSHAGGVPRRTFGSWLLAWLGRELMALPVWAWAVLFGTTVKWRGKTFHVRLDTSVVEVTGQTPGRKGSRTPELERASKDRVD